MSDCLSQNEIHDSDGAFEDEAVVIEGIHEKKTLIDILNDDCLIQIFMYLPLKERLSLELVCWRWNRLAKLAWYDLIIHNGQYEKAVPLKYNMNRCGRYIKYLDLGCIPDTKIIPMMRDNCERIVYLRFIAKQYDEEDFHEAFSKMKKLRSIVCHFCGPIPRFFISTLQQCPEKMESISLTTPMLFETKPDLYCGIPPELPVSIFKRFNSLRVLDILGCYIDTEIMEMITEIESLVALGLRCCIFENSSPIPSFSRLRNLEKVDLRLTHKTDHILVPIAEGCKNVKYLNLDGSQVTIRGFSALLQFKKLEGLSLEEWTPYPVTYFGSIIPCVRNLKTLNFSSHRFTDHYMIEIIKNSPNLELLCLSCTAVTPEGLKMAADLTRHRKNNVVLNIDIKFWDEYANEKFNTPLYASPFLEITLGGIEEKDLWFFDIYAFSPKIYKTLHDYVRWLSSID